MVNKRNVTSLVVALMASLLVGCGEEQETVAKDLPRQESIQCALDSINGVNAPVMETKTGKADFRGWAADSNSNTTPETLNVVLTDTKGVSYVFSGAQRTERPDVVKATGQNAFLKSGFMLSANVSSLAKGTYGVRLEMPYNNNIVVCKVKKVLLVN